MQTSDAPPQNGAKPPQNPDAEDFRWLKRGCRGKLHTCSILIYFTNSISHYHGQDRLTQATSNIRICHIALSNGETRDTPVVVTMEASYYTCRGLRKRQA
jgi:hypothetical protein